MIKTHKHSDLSCVINLNWNSADQLIKGSQSGEAGRLQGGTGGLKLVLPSHPSLLTFRAQRARLCEPTVYADTWMIFYPVTPFLSLRFREQTDGPVMIKSLLLVTTKM